MHVIAGLMYLLFNEQKDTSSFNVSQHMLSRDRILNLLKLQVRGIQIRVGMGYWASLQRTEGFWNNLSIKAQMIFIG